MNCAKFTLYTAYAGALLVGMFSAEDLCEAKYDILLLNKAREGDGRELITHFKHKRTGVSHEVKW